MCKCIAAGILNMVFSVLSVIIGLLLLIITSVLIGDWYPRYTSCHGGIDKVPTLSGTCKHTDLYIAGAAFAILAAVIHLVICPIFNCLKMWKVWAVCHIIIFFFILIAFILPMCAGDGYGLADVVKIGAIASPKDAYEQSGRLIAIFFLLITIIDAAFSPLAAAIVWCLNKEDKK